MNIPMNATVECTDGTFGRSEYLIMNPVIDQVTHLIVKQAVSPNTEYLVPLELISETIAGTIRLRCSQAELEQLEPFCKTTYIHLPYVPSEGTFQTPVKHQQIPGGELALRRGTRVEATDGYIGKINEFVVNPRDGAITHLVMREGHLWNQKEVVIPFSALGTTLNDTIFLKLSKLQVESLPTLRLQRRWS